MLEGTVAIINEVLEPIKFGLEYLTVNRKIRKTMVSRFSNKIYCRITGREKS
jgi:hypothetical protein